MELIKMSTTNYWVIRATQVFWNSKIELPALGYNKYINKYYTR